jgi:hypothetical protein
MVNSVEAITPQLCSNGFREFEYQMDMVPATKGAQVEVQ